MSDKTTLPQRIIVAQQILDETHPEMGGTGKALAAANDRIRELETIPMKYRRMGFNARLQREYEVDVPEELR